MDFMIRLRVMGPEPSNARATALVPNPKDLDPVAFRNVNTGAVG
jgi:hypothetical protein